MHHQLKQAVENDLSYMHIYICYELPGITHGLLLMRRPNYKLPGTPHGLLLMRRPSYELPGIPHGLLLMHHPSYELEHLNLERQSS